MSNRRARPHFWTGCPRHASAPAAQCSQSLWRSALNQLKPSIGRRGYLALATIVLTLAATVFALPVFALDSGVFELDGNAVTSHGAGAPDDWDRVCHQVLGSGCSTTSNTTGATAVEFASQTVANGHMFTGGGSKDPIDISSWLWQ